MLYPRKEKRNCSTFSKESNRTLSWKRRISREWKKIVEINERGLLLKYSHLCSTWGAVKDARGDPCATASLHALWRRRAPTSPLLAFFRVCKSANEKVVHADCATIARSTNPIVEKLAGIEGEAPLERNRNRDNGRMKS